MGARVALLVGLALVAAPAASAQTPLETLDAGVSAPLNIWIREGATDVVHLQESGLYRFEVLDNTNDHNFRLSGNGITERRTEIFTNPSPVRHIWDVVLPPGLYHYNCEHHAQMFGDFTVGDVVWVEGTGLGTGTIRSAGGEVDWPRTNRGAPFAPGTEVTLTATAGAGSKFLGWSGGCSGTGACTVAVNGRVNVQAQFVPALGGSGGGGTGASASITRVAVAKTRAGRVVRATLNVRRHTAVAAQLRRNARVVASKSQQLMPGTRVVSLAVPRRAKAGAHTLRLRFRDVAANTSVTVNRTVRIPKP